MTATKHPGYRTGRLSRWLGAEDGKTDTFLLAPDDPKSQAGERLIIFVACCEALVLLSACLFGLWIYLRDP